jgi:uncharacterized protein YdcH (DUF465 family)
MRQSIGSSAGTNSAANIANDVQAIGGKVSPLTRLEEAHRSLELELANLTRRTHLTPEEEVRARAIKKQKLKTKDRIRVLMSRATME